MTEQRDRVDINWVQVSASALAAVSSAVLLSTVGVAGTIIGAAIGSLFATAGSAIYSHYLRVTRERVARAQALALRVTKARAGASGVWADTRQAEARGGTQTLRAQQKSARAEADVEDAERDLDEAAGERPPWREILAGLPWKWISAVTAGVFVLAMLVILTFELVTGHAVSSYTGGSDPGARTSVPGVGSAPASSTPTPEPTQKPSSGTSSSVPSPSASPSGSTTPSPSASPNDDAPSSVPSTVAPTPTPTVVPTPTEAQTPTG